MNGLRLALLIIGLIIIVGIYFWGMRSSLLQQRFTKKRHYHDEKTLDMGDPLPEAEDDLDHFDALDDQGEPWLEDRPEERWEHRPRTDPTEAHILVLYLVAAPDHPYSGDAIQSAAEAVGMQFGEMDVFHHFGIGVMRTPRSLFCLANIFEPGKFDLERMAELETAGLILFMSLPPPGDSQLAFELMLNTAQRLSQRLGGELLDDHREPLSAESIERLRTVVAKARHVYT